MKYLSVFSWLFFLLLFSNCNQAQDSQGAQEWLQFLGPARNSTSTETGILRSWPENGPEILWTANVGIGYGQ